MLGIYYLRNILTVGTKRMSSLYSNKQRYMMWNTNKREEKMCWYPAVWRWRGGWDINGAVANEGIAMLIWAQVMDKENAAQEQSCVCCIWVVAEVDSSSTRDVLFRGFLISCISDLPGEGGFFSFPSKSFLLTTSFSKCLLTMDTLFFYYYENFNFTLVSEGIEFPSTSLGIDFYICSFFFLFFFCSVL